MGVKNLIRVTCLVVLFSLLVQVTEAKKSKKKTDDFVFTNDDEELILGDEPGSGDGQVETSTENINIDNEIPPFTQRPRPTWPPERPTSWPEWAPERPTSWPEWAPERPTSWPEWPPARPTSRPEWPPVRPTSRPWPPARPTSGPVWPPVRPTSRPITPCRYGTRRCNPSLPCQPLSKPCPSIPAIPCTTSSCRTPPKVPQRCRPCRSNKRLCATKRNCRPKLPPVSLPPAYIPTQTCGKTYYCRQGYRGPCNKNEILTPTPISYMSRPISTVVGSTCYSRPVGCFSKNPFELPQKSSNTGYCTVRYPKQPCYGYPSDYRYSHSTRKCYPTVSFPTRDEFMRRRRTVSDPCPATQIFMPEDKYFGQCRCSQPNYVRSKNTNRCYPAYTKGSCQSGQWLVPVGNTGLSTCQQSPCPSLADGRHIFWSGKGQRYGRPGCYKSNTQGPCRPGMRFVINDIMSGSSRCVPNRQYYDLSF